MRQRVLVASNRGPVSYWFGADGTLIGRRGGGGLIAGVTSGLGALALEADVSWICGRSLTRTARPHDNGVQNPRAQSNLRAHRTL